jgi:hypothetical protein
MRPRRTYVAWRYATRENIALSTMTADDWQRSIIAEPIPSTRAA